jgi:hypothetical protein
MFVEMKLVAGGVTALLMFAGMASTSSAVWGQSTPAAPSNDGDFVVRATITPGIGPGGSRPVHLTASNPGSSAITVTSVRVLKITADPDHASCVTADFTMADVAQHAQLPADAVDYRLASGTLAYENTDVNQDSCQGATLTLSLSSR